MIEHLVSLISPLAGNCIAYSNGTTICTTTVVSVQSVPVPTVPTTIEAELVIFGVMMCALGAICMFLLWGMGTWGRRFFRYKGPAAFITYPDNTYDMQKVKRVAAFLRVRSKRYNNYAYAGEGTAFIRANSPSMYLVDYRAGTAANPKVVQYGGLVSGTERAAGLFKNPLNKPKFAPQEIGELVLLWYKDKLNSMFYKRKVKHLSIQQQDNMDPLAKQQYNLAVTTDDDEQRRFNQQKNIDLNVIDEILYNKRPEDAAAALTDQEKQEFIEKVATRLANEPQDVWPAWIGGVTWDARRVLRWALSTFRPEDVQNIDIIARNEERLETKSGNNRMMIIIFGIIAVVLVAYLIIHSVG